MLRLWLCVSVIFCLFLTVFCFMFSPQSSALGEENMFSVRSKACPALRSGRISHHAGPWIQFALGQLQWTREFGFTWQAHGAWGAWGAGSLLFKLWGCWNDFERGKYAAIGSLMFSLMLYILGAWMRSHAALPAIPFHPVFFKAKFDTRLQLHPTARLNFLEHFPWPRNFQNIPWHEISYKIIQIHKNKYIQWHKMFTADFTVPGESPVDKVMPLSQSLMRF